MKKQKDLSIEKRIAEPIIMTKRANKKNENKRFIFYLAVFARVGLKKENNSLSGKEHLCYKSNSMIYTNTPQFCCCTRESFYQKKYIGFVIASSKYI